MPGLGKAIDVLLEQGGIFAALFIIACSAIVSLIGAIVYLYKQGITARNRYEEDAKAWEKRRQQLNDKYEKDLTVTVGAMERNTLSFTSLQLALEARQRALTEMTDAFRQLTSIREQNIVRINEVGFRLERGLDQALRDISNVREELARLKARSQ